MPKKPPKPIAPTKTPPDTRDADRLGLDRLIFFSDAVFAIAITLLVLDIRLPAGVESQNNRQLLAILLSIWPQYMAYLISFLVIGTIWVSHHRKFRLIKRYDSGLISLNMLLLMVIVFIPFPSQVMSTNGNQTSTILYASTMILASLMMGLIWWHASHHDRLLVEGVDARQRRRETLTPLITIAIFLVSIGISFIDTSITRLLWVLILPASIYFNRY
jgi:uncharacterized membrane protein